MRQRTGIGCGERAERGRHDEACAHGQTEVSEGANSYGNAAEEQHAKFPLGRKNFVQQRSAKQPRGIAMKAAALLSVLAFGCAHAVERDVVLNHEMYVSVVAHAAGAKAVRGARASPRSRTHVCQPTAPHPALASPRGAPAQHLGRHSSAELQTRGRGALPPRPRSPARLVSVWPVPAPRPTRPPHAPAPRERAPRPRTHISLSATTNYRSTSRMAGTSFATCPCRRPSSSSPTAGWSTLRPTPPTARRPWR